MIGLTLPKKYDKLKPANFSSEKKIEYFLDLQNVQKMLERKIVPSADNNLAIGSKIPEERILKTHLWFLSELVREHPGRWMDSDKLRYFSHLVSRVSSATNSQAMF
jgi:hypothetical protein